MFLAPTDVERLTGLELPYAQERWLLKHGINCLRNARNEVIVPVAAVLDRFGVDSEGSGTLMPDLDAMEKLANAETKGKAA